jgi:hypothetical protein
MRRLMCWLTMVHTTDPLRCVLNRGLAAVLLTWILLLIPMITALALSHAPLMRVVGTALLIPAFAFAWWLNRYSDSLGATVATLLIILSVLAAVDIQKYLTTWGQPIVIDLPLVVPVLMSAFFASPWSVLWVTTIEISFICLNGVYIGVAHDRIANFAIFGSLTLLPVALCIALLAHMYQQALMRSFDENARLTKLLYTDEYTVDLVLAKMTESDDHRDTQ